jgi:hypothetical protein
MLVVLIAGTGTASRARPRQDLAKGQRTSLLIPKESPSKKRRAGRRSSGVGARNGRMGSEGPKKVLLPSARVLVLSVS